MKTVTICGSMRFHNEMLQNAWRLETEEGLCVLQPIFSTEQESLSAKGYQNIKDAHFKKIDLSDAIFVVNVGGYIGESTRGEIEYAKKHGKEILFLEEEK